MMDALGVSGWQGLMTFAAMLALAYVAAVWIGLAFWTWRDVSRRTAEASERLTAVGLVVMFSVPGWLVYLLMRPQETIEEVNIDRLQQELLARELGSPSVCRRCRRRVSEDFLVCPYCREALRVPCRSCERPVSLAWEACAYCGASRAPRRTWPAEQPAASATGSRKAPVPPVFAR